jgi:hypothetical protein
MVAPSFLFVVLISSCGKASFSSSSRSTSSPSPSTLASCRWALCRSYAGRHEELEDSDDSPTASGEDLAFPVGRQAKQRASILLVARTRCPDPRQGNIRGLMLREAREVSRASAPTTGQGIAYLTVPSPATGRNSRALRCVKRGVLRGVCQQCLHYLAVATEDEELQCRISIERN